MSTENSNEAKIRILEKKREMMNSVSESFCSAKWLQNTLYLQNGYNHSCHHPAPHIIPLHEVEENPAALHNTHFKKEQRKLMLKGHRPKECDYCWKIEDLNKDHFSDRHYKTSDLWAWDRFEEISKSNPNDDVNPSYLEVSFSNACNFKCLYCSPEISSRWLDEIEEHGPYPVTRGSQDLNWLKEINKFPYKHNEHNPYVEAFWKWFPDLLPSLRVFRITGGEPLMSKDTWRVLDYIRQNPQPNLELAINTNLGVDDRLIERLIEEVNNIKDCVKRVDIYTSLESTGKQAEYTRFGLDYDKWLKNVRLVLDKTDCLVAIMTTVNILSLPTFINFIEEVMQLRKEYNFDFAYNRIPLTINFLRWPPHLSVKILPEDMRKEYASQILSTCEQWLKYYRKETFARIYLEEWDQIQRFCNFLIKNDFFTNERYDFVDYVLEADKRRNTNFKETFPEYAQLIDKWNDE